MEKPKKKHEEMTKEELVLEVKRLSKEIDKCMAYGLIWEDKPEFVKINDQFEELFTVIAKYFPVLEPDMSLSHISSKNSTNHLLIECENYFGLYSILALTKNISDLNVSGFSLIYLDPPYNTGNQDFFYNDNYVDKNDQYPHSKWLSFMYKRLLIAKFLLKDSGAIAIQIDDRELFNLKLLCDKVFGEDNFVNNITIKMSELSGVKMTHVGSGNKFPKVKESILIFSKKKEMLKLKIPKISKDKWDSEFSIFLDNFSKEDRENIQSLEEKGISSDKQLDHVDNILSKIKMVNVSSKLNQKMSEEEIIKWKYENAWRIVRSCPSKSIKDLAVSKIKTLKEIPALISLKSKRDGKLYIAKTDFDFNGKSPRVQIIFADNSLESYVSDIWMDIGTTALGSEMPDGVPQFNNGQKPLKLLERILNLSEDDPVLILDFFGGSGSTSHAGMLLDKNGKNVKTILMTNNDVSMEENVKFLKATLKMSDEDLQSLYFKIFKKKISFNKKAKISFDKMIEILNYVKKKIDYEEYIKLGICRKFTNPRLVSVAKENNQNLLYYRIKMIERGNSTKQLKRNLKKHLTEMVKIKEDLNNENRIIINNFSKKSELEAFVNKNGCLILIIYDIFININKLKSELNDYDNVKLYIYSTEGVELEEFKKLSSKKVEIIDALDEILKVYRQLD